MSIFPTKIVLATDGSKEAQLAATTAADLANSTHSELHLLCVAPGNPDPVYQIHEAGLRYETYEQALEAVKGEAQEVLDGQQGPWRDETSTDGKRLRLCGSPRSLPRDGRASGEATGRVRFQDPPLACVLTRSSFAMGFIFIAKLSHLRFWLAQALFFRAG